MDDRRVSLGRRRLLRVTGGLWVAGATSLAGCTWVDEEGPANGEDPVDEDDPADEGADEADEAESDEEESVGETGDEATVDEELTTDSANDDFVDMTGEETVEIETREGDDGEPDFVFDPPFVRIDVGTTVEWTNTDGVFHTVTSTDSLEQRSGGGDEFDATISSEGESFEWEAAESGTQPYYCSPHAGFMYGALEIE